MKLRKQENGDSNKVWKIGNIEENQRERILQLLQELQEVCHESGIIVECKFAKEGKQLISDKVKEMEHNMTKQSKAHQENYQSNKVNGMKDKIMGRLKRYQDTYRENKEKKANILKQYETTLAEIEAQHEERVEKINTQKNICGNQEQSSMFELYELKQEIKEIKKSPQYKQHTEQTEQELKRLKNRKKTLKQLQHECDQELLNCEIERTNSIIDAGEKKYNQLRTLKKQNIFQKIAGALINKKNDTKVFEETVRYIKDEKVPKVRQYTQVQTADFCQSMNQKRERIVGKNQNISIQLMKEMQDRVTGNIESVNDLPAKDTDEAITI